MPRPIFLLGNKRSGTSHLTRLLNAHPQIYVAPEADLVWALLCRHRGAALEPYPLDGPRGLKKTVAKFGDLLSDSRASTDALFRRMLAVLAKEARKAPDDLQWIGDKKPVQHADPEVFAFIRATWPDARFVHIVRHPKAAVLSMKAAFAGHLAFMSVWNRTDEQLLSFWTKNEQHVLAYKKAGIPIFSLTFPNLIAAPADAMGALTDFLELPVNSDFQRFAETNTTSQDDKYDDYELELSKEARHIIEHYSLS